MNDDLRQAAERLADAVQGCLEDGEFWPSPPQGFEFDDRPEGEQELPEALEGYLERHGVNLGALTSALHAFRRAQERELSARALAARALSRETAHISNPTPKKLESAEQVQQHEPA